jgi:hypothetical protein
VSDQKQEEYVALRATIRERTTVRLILFVTAMALWAALAITTWAVTGIPVAMLIPLLVLGAGFEAVYALHLNVERIGRYLQVFHEDGDGWEHVAMEYGRRYPGAGPDPLFGVWFLCAIGLNYIPVALDAAIGRALPELVVLGAVHAALAVRLIVARRRAGRQRVEDIERFTALQSRRGH